MAQSVKKSTAAALAFMGCFIVWGAMLQAHAENLPDPTRPSSRLNQDEGGGVSSGPVLQSVLISPARKMAIISGQAVKLGESFGSAKLIKVTEGEAVLRDGNELQILKLFPGIEKRETSSDVRKYSASTKTKR